MKRLLFKAMVGGAMLGLLGGVSWMVHADELDELNVQKAVLDQEMESAKAKFKKSLPSIPAYREAKELIDSIDNEISAARVNDDSRKVLMLAKQKLAANKTLREIMKLLQLNDPGIARVQKKLADIIPKFDRAYKIRQADIERQQRLAKEEQQKKRRLYREIVEFDYSKEPRGMRKSVPLLGDEISLAEPSAEPKKFLGRPFIVAGAVKISDYYNFAYSDAKPTHYSLTITQVSADLQAGGSAAIYLERSRGQSVIEILSERERLWPEWQWCMRVKMMLDPKFIKTFDDAEETYEVLDWQYLGKDGWTPWYSEVVD